MSKEEGYKPLSQPATEMKYHSAPQGAEMDLLSDPIGSIAADEVKGNIFFSLYITLALFPNPNSLIMFLPKSPFSSVHTKKNKNK